MRQRILQVCTLKHSIKKGMFSLVGKMNLFRSGRNNPSHPPPHLVYVPVFTEQIAESKTEKLIKVDLHSANVIHATV